MHIEVLCTGDELLTGIIADTNSPYFLGKMLLELGQQAKRVTVVGDVRLDLHRALLEASVRSDVVIVSGGLGPTADDLTVECAAAAQGVPLVESAEALNALEQRFAARGITVSPNNRKQALVPQGAEVVMNPIGSAPMFIQRLGRCTLFYLPGVPREYRHLVDHAVLPHLREALAREGEGRTFRAVRLLKVMGLPESQLDAAVAPLGPHHPDVAFGFRTLEPENHLKLVAQAPRADLAEQHVEAAAKACREVLRPWLFAEGEQSFAGALGVALQARGETLAAAESCTGGWVAQLVTAEAGASAYFHGSAVTYVEALKQRWASVSAASLERHGAVSREVALEMAAGVRRQAGTTYGLSTTGFAGPSGGTLEEPLGTVYCALAWEGGSRCERLLLSGERERIRLLATYGALDVLRRHLVETRKA